MARRHTLLLELSYDGSVFHGVARQPGYATVSETLEHHLFQVFGVEPKGLAFAARTDRGVSALQNYATCWFRDLGTSSEDPSRVTIALPGLQVHVGHWVDRAINARTNSADKHYRYLIRDGLPKSEAAHVTSPRVWSMAPRLDVGLMQEAAAHLVGTHDYSAFRAAGCDGKDPIKTVTAIEVARTERGVAIDVAGTAFLRKMVRIIAGTLAEVGAGLRTVESVASVLRARDRRRAGLTAPGHGLCLMSVQLTGVAVGLRGLAPWPMSALSEFPNNCRLPGCELWQNP